MQQGGGMEPVQAPDQELLGAGPLPAHEPHGGGRNVKSGRQGPSGFVRGPSVGGGRGHPDQHLLARHLQSRPRPGADANLDERPAGCLPNRLHAPCLPTNVAAETPAHRTVQCPAKGVDGNEYPGNRATSESGTVGARWPAPETILPAPPPDPGSPPQWDARSRRGRVPPVTAEGRGAPRARAAGEWAPSGTAGQAGWYRGAHASSLYGTGRFFCPARNGGGSERMTRYRPVDAKVDLRAV